MSGSFSQVAAPEIFRVLLDKKRTGKLRVQVGSYRKTVYFERGRPVYAVSSDPKESMGELLVRAGRLEHDQLREALRRAPSSRKVGTTLVELGFLTPHDLVEGVKSEVTEVILSLFVLVDGTFHFEECDLAVEEIARLSLKLEDILREGVGRMRDPRLILRVLGGSLEGVLEAPKRKPAIAIPLDAREMALLQTLRSARASVRDLCKRSNQPAIDTCRSLVRFVAAGAAHRVA